MSEEWYLETTYDEAKRIIRANLNTMSRSFIAVGFYLKHIRDNGLYQEDGYHDIWEFAADQYGIQRSTASRWMAMNDRFSVGGNSPVLLEEYRDFGKSQLQEMLYLPEEKLSEATPDMTVKEIRELRREEAEVEEGAEEEPISIPEEEPVSILGYPLREYPEGSLLTVPGCGKQDCFSCHWDGCGLRQVDCYCVEAPMGKPFPCTILQEGTDILREQVGNHCQFVNTDLAPIRAGDGQPVPCCKKCTVDCTYRCERSCKDLGTGCATPHTKNISREDAPGEIRDSRWFVKQYFDNYGESELPEVMRICRRYSSFTDKAKNIKKLLSPYGWHGGGNTEFGYCFRDYRYGVDFDADNNKQEIHMTYPQLVRCLLDIYDPMDPQWDDVGGEFEKRKASSETQKESSAEKKTSEFSAQFVQDTLRKYEYELKIYQECNAHIEHPEEKIPEETILKRKVIVAGLKMLLEVMQKEEAEDE